MNKIGAARERTIHFLIEFFTSLKILPCVRSIGFLLAGITRLPRKKPYRVTGYGKKDQRECDSCQSEPPEFLAFPQFRASMSITFRIEDKTPSSLGLEVRAATAAAAAMIFATMSIKKDAF
tara:strand:+ start:17642 stop:18004 length:363 start_codon:yes stop_codon:yes gene_type:complete